MGVKSRHSSKYRHGLNFIVQCRPFEKHGADVLLCGGPASNAANLRMQRGIAIDFIEFDLKAKWKRDWRLNGGSGALNASVGVAHIADMPKGMRGMCLKRQQ